MSGYILKHHSHAYALLTRITTLSAQHCSRGMQVLILAKEETFEKIYWQEISKPHLQSWTE